MKSRKNCNMIFQKWGRGVKGRLEFFPKNSAVLEAPPVPKGQWGVIYTLSVKSTRRYVRQKVTYLPTSWTNGDFLLNGDLHHWYYNLTIEIYPISHWYLVLGAFSPFSHNMDGPLLPTYNNISWLTGKWKTTKWSTTYILRLLILFAKIDVELANILFAQSDSFLRNLDAEDGTCLLFALCKCRKWSALTITSNAVTITTTFIHHNCHHQHIEGFLTKNVFFQELPGKG